MATNALRMTLADWDICMIEAGVPRNARNIARTAAIHQVRSNSDLAEKSGYAADSGTINSAKRFLAKYGWIIPTGIRGGRGNGCEVIPAVHGTPVEITHVYSRKGGKNNLGNNRERGVKNTQVKVAETPPKIAPLLPAHIEERARVCAQAQKELPKGNTLSATGSTAADVTVNGSAIHGPGWQLDFGAIDIDASLLGLTKAQGRQIAEATARSWVAENFKPDRPHLALKRALRDFKNNNQIDSVRVSKAGQTPWRGGAKRQKTSDEIRKEIEQM